MDLAQIPRHALLTLQEEIERHLRHWSA
jgi:hypothetical protein